jgi:DNA polymerase IV
MSRNIIHLNVSNFMAVVETIQHTAYRDRPLVIAPESQARAIILDLSERAYREGIRRGMPLYQAKKLLKELITINPHPELYSRAEDAMYELAYRYSPVVEQAYRGNIYVDISGTERLFGNPKDLAAKLQKEFKNDLNLDPIIGLASNKLVSKVATRIIKPHGFISVNPGDESEFLNPHKIIMLPGVGDKISTRLENLGIKLIGQLAHLEDDQVIIALGPKGLKLRDAAQGLDFSPVLPASNPDPAIQSERILTDDSNNLYNLTAHLYDMIEDVGFILRQQNLATKKLSLYLSYTDDLESFQAQKLPKAIYTDQDMFKVGKGLLDTALNRRIRVRKLTLLLSQLTPEHRQLELFTPLNTQKEQALQVVIDDIRKRYGKDALKYALTLNQS